MVIFNCVKKVYSWLNFPICREKLTARILDLDAARCQGRRAEAGRVLGKYPELVLPVLDQVRHVDLGSYADGRVDPVPDVPRRRVSLPPVYPVALDPRASI